jgi:outer membrane protein OmpA-like peptidoglycan-associated protein
MLLAASVVPAMAQQTVIIGGGPPVIGRGAGGVVVNDEVLESLGPVRSAPALAYPSPGAVPAAPGVVYRQPDTGQLLVSRPSTLLFPPPRYPKSRLTAQAPARGPAQAPQPGAAEPELASRLLVPPAPKAAPRAPSQVAETPAPAPKMAPVPVEPVAEKPVAAAEPPPPPQQVQPAPKPEAAEPAVEAQTAALPPAGTLAEHVRVLFQEGSAELSDDARGRLASLAKVLKANAAVRVQLLAYAKGTAESASRARRLSLSRALTVRAFLIEEGVRSTRMDVRALGDKAGDGPVDRVDILPQPASQ